MSKDQDIVDEARSRFKLCSDREAFFRANFRYDRRFEAQDCTNNFGWPDDMYTARTNAGRSCLTVNKVHQHVLNVTNDAKVNRPAIKISPVSGGATFKASEILMGLVRHICYVSNADDAFDTALRDAVIGGIGYFRITTDYVSDDSFDTEVFINRIPDAMSVYLDTDIKEFDGSDARYGFIFGDWAKDEFDRTYPKFKDEVTQSAPLGISGTDDTWQSRDDDNKHVRVVEYYRKMEKKDRLHMLADGTMVHESDAKEGDFLDILKANSIRSRAVTRDEVEWFLIANDEIIDRNIFPSKYIPIVRIVGEERCIDGILDRFGLVRAMIDSQRMYNVMSSAAVEYVGGQTKTPWIISASAIESFETYWENANRETFPYLPYNDYDDEGNREIDAPKRADAPIYAPAYQQALVQAASDMDMVSGQHEASFGQPSQERSGAAINARVSMASNATGHFIYNLAIGIRYAGKIILDVIPKIYDTRRTLRILGNDGAQSTIQIDPEMRQAHQDVPGSDDEDFSPEQISAVLNPLVGKFDVIADVSARSFATQRMETFNALAGILQQNESLVPIIGKYLFKVMDVPLADEIGDALDEHFGSQADPQLQAAQQHLAAQHGVMMQQQQEIQQLKSKILIEQQQKEIDLEKLMNERFKIVTEADPELAKVLIRHMGSQALGTDVKPILQAEAIGNTVLQQTLGSIFPEGDQSAQGGAPPILPNAGPSN